jgi:hypothetical protein
LAIADADGEVMARQACFSDVFAQVVVFRALVSVVAEAALVAWIEVAVAIGHLTGGGQKVGMAIGASRQTGFVAQEIADPAGVGRMATQAGVFVGRVLNGRRVGRMSDGRVTFEAQLIAARFERGIGRTGVRAVARFATPPKVGEMRRRAGQSFHFMASGRQATHLK